MIKGNSKRKARLSNARQTEGGKGDTDRIKQADKDRAPIWCNCFPARFKDKCKVCNEH